MRLTFQEQLDCPHSYATEDNKNLLCDIGDNICDGIVYDCCLWDNQDLERRVFFEGGVC